MYILYIHRRDRDIGIPGLFVELKEQTGEKHRELAIISIFLQTTSVFQKLFFLFWKLEKMLFRLKSGMVDLWV